MKRNKLLRKVLSLFLIMIFVLSPFGDSGIVVKKAKAATYALYSGSSGTPIREIDLMDGERDLRISSSDNTAVGIDFTWSVTPANGEVVDITGLDPSLGAVTDPNRPVTQIKIKPKRPGEAVVTLEYRVGSGASATTTTLACSIYVGFKIKKEEAADKFPLPGDNRVLVLDKKNEVFHSTYQAVPENPVNFIFPSDSGYKMNWTSSDNTIAEVDEQGLIYARGAGFCTITGNGTVPSRTKTISDSIKVLVLPREYTSAGCPNSDEIIASSTSPKIFEPFDPSNDSFYMNNTLASKFHFKIYDRETDAILTDTLDSLPTSTDVKLSPDSVSNRVRFLSTTKAGRYYMNTYISDGGSGKQLIAANEKEIFSKGYPNQMYFYVPIHFNFMKKNVSNTYDNSGTVRLNVNDVYNLKDNSNIKSLDHFSVTPIGTATQFATYDSLSGKFTAVKEGSATYSIKLKSDNAAKYNESAGEEYKITLEVADGLKLNVTETSIPVGRNVLQLRVTNNNIHDVTWESNNTSYVTVDGDGNLSGIAEGVADISATALVDGIVKRAVCKVYVYASANKITISPEQVTVNVNKTTTVDAIFEPVGVTSVDLKWISLDETIAEVKAVPGRTDSAHITGKKAGETMIMAVSKNNIVLGTCKVKVTEKIDSIKLSETKVEVPLSQGTYTIKATVSPATASVDEISWSSSDEKVATVVGGKLTLHSAGETIITASSTTNTSCKPQYCSVKVTQSVTGLTLASTEKVIYMGETATIGYTVLPSTAGNKSVTWSSTKPSIATVNSSSGLLTPVSVGETTIIARTVEGNYMKTCTIYVKEKAKGISIDLRDVVVQVGEEYKIPYTLNPKTSTEADIKWTSTNTAVATVTNKGVVKGVVKGSTIIMAKLTNGEIAYCNVSVQEKVTGLQLNFEKKTIYKGKTFTLKATVTPNDATNPAVTFTSSNEKVATISSKGKVTGKKAGTTIITVKTKDKGYIAYCVVTVKENVTSIKLNHSSYKLGYKKSVKLVAKVTTTASNKKLKWTSSNPSVATVNSSGKVTAKKYGKTTITVTALDGSGKKATCSIQVVRLATKVKLNKYSMTIVVGRKAKLKATVTPKNATYRGVKWTSSNKDVATVSSGGTVYATDVGITYITAKAKDSSNKKAVCRVEVKAAVSASNITIITDDVVLSVNQSKIMPKSVTPPTSTDSVTWSTDNEYVATVNKATGKVTGKHPGVCTISAYTTSGKSDTATVTVLGISRTKLTLEQYSKHKLYLEGVTRGVTWESTNLSVATVDSNGNVVTKRPGTANIIATYRGTKFVCKVKVKKIN